MSLPPVTQLNQMPLEAVFEAFASTGLLRRLLEIARDEDLGPEGRDITSGGAGGDGIAAMRLAARVPLTVSGLAALPLLADVYGATIAFEIHTPDGSTLREATTMATLRARRSVLLALERPLLNLVGRLSGVATLTRRYVDAASGTGARILDTRKTTPGLRLFEKYAVRCGGGLNHRLSLHDAVLVKDNHIAHVPDDELASFICGLVSAARVYGPAFVQVEVDRLDQFERLLALEAGVIDIVLLDNMGPDLLARASARRDAVQPGLQLEASGGVRLETVGAIARSGVDRISIGALTHGAVWVDVGFDAVT